MNGKIRQEAAIIDAWQEEYPFCFPKWPAPKVPLAKDIESQLRAAWLSRHRSDYKDITDEELAVFIRDALRLWKLGIRYNLALCHGNRYNLDGNEAQPYDEQQVRKTEKRMRKRMQSDLPKTCLVFEHYFKEHDAADAEKYYLDVYADAIARCRLQPERRGRR